MDDREFEDFETSILINGQWVPVRITSSALHALWGSGAGPQDEEGLFQKHRHLFEAVLAEKQASGSFMGARAVISDADLDM